MSKQQPINFIIDLQIFPYQIMFSFAETSKQVKKMLKGYKIHFDKQGEDIINEAEGKYRTIMFPTGQTLVMIEKVPENANEYAVLIHEIFHAVANVMRNVGMIFSTDSEEVYAYCIQYVTQEVLERLWKINESDKKAN